MLCQSVRTINTPLSPILEPIVTHQLNSLPTPGLDAP